MNHRREGSQQEGRTSSRSYNRAEGSSGGVSCSSRGGSRVSGFPEFKGFLGF